jgi:hypothetical protein
MALFDPPWRFEHWTVPKSIRWGGHYILLQFFAGAGGSAARDIHVKIDFPNPPPRYDAKGKLIPYNPPKIVYARDQLLVDGSGNHFYEGMFLIKVGGLPQPDPNTGEVPVLLNVTLTGASDPDDQPSNTFCGLSTLHVSYKNHYEIQNFGDPLNTLVLSTTVTTTITDPNGTRTEVAENWVNNLTDDLLGIGRATADDFVAHPQAPNVASDHSQWFFSTTTGKYVDTRQACGVYVPVPFDVRFTCDAWLFPGGMVVYPADKYFPLRKRGPVPEGSPPGTKGPLLDWFDAFTFTLNNDNAANIDLPSGVYPFKLEPRKFREFDLPYDGSDDLPPLKEPFTDADEQARQKENAKRREAKHRMLILYPTNFTYQITLFRYPREKVPPTIPPTPPPAIPTSFDVEWRGPFSGPPPTLKTLDPNT